MRQCEVPWSHRPREVHNLLQVLLHKQKLDTGKAEEKLEKAFVHSAGRGWEIAPIAETPPRPIFPISPMKQKL